MSNIRYGRPNMNNLPYELGKAIFEEILHSKPVNREQFNKEVDEFKKQMIEARRKEDNEKSE
ncbi:MAG: hypothetical protein IK151_05535 [Erysipelotrichaceae bacterium]|nr:hypothetical protein [Erysipelotrichaceae bacterium]